MKLFNSKQEKSFRKYLRHNTTPAEKMLWGYLRKKQLGYKFRRQVSIGIYVVDFYCPSIKLSIEIDGDSHFFQRSFAHDKKRDKYLESLGIRIIRFTNQEIYFDLARVLKAISEIINNDQNPSQPPL